MKEETMRNAFTLVEMLIALFIAAALATLTAVLLPRFNQERMVARGAEELQGYLIVAKSRALRDQLPTGVRLMPDANGLVRTVQMIQQPDWFTGGSVYTDGNSTLIAGGLVLPSGEVSKPVDFTGGFNDPALYPVQPGDYAEILGGTVHRIVTVEPHRLTLASPLPNAVQKRTVVDPKTHKLWLVGTATYHVVRQPRLLVGEMPLELPQDVAVDLNTNQQFNGPIPPTRPDGSIDLLFLPSGALADCAGSFCPLWVRDTTQDSIWYGEPRLIVVYIRTGSVAAQPVNDAADPYLFCRDGR